MFKNKLIRLQISYAAVTAQRPHIFPKSKSRDGAALVTELEMLLKNCGEAILKTWGGILRDLAKQCGVDLPTLTKHFDAIMINDIPETYEGRLHTDDPAIDLRSATLFADVEISTAVLRAIESKRKKRYSTDLLVLHTLEADHKPHFPGSGMHAEQIVRVGQALATSLLDRFREVWFLNAYWDESGKRLYRLA